MQYLISEEEFKNLIDKSEVEKRDEALEVARQIIKKTPNETRCRSEFCEGCPISYMGHDDDDSFKPNREQMNLICKLPKRYHK